MQQVNAAYEQIKNPNKASSGSRGYGSYGGYGGFDPFGSYRSQSYDQGDDRYQRSAYQYIRFNRFREALNVLENCEQKDARWYFLSALANNGLGNQVTALEHIRRAVSMEPENMEYLQALNIIERGGAAYRRQADMFTGFSMQGNPCMNLCLCYFFQLCCCPCRC